MKREHYSPFYSENRHARKYHYFQRSGGSRRAIKMIMAARLFARRPQSVTHLRLRAPQHCRPASIKRQHYLIRSHGLAADACDAGFTRKSPHAREALTAASIIVAADRRRIALHGGARMKPLVGAASSTSNNNRCHRPPMPAMPAHKYYYHDRPSALRGRSISARCLGEIFTPRS